MTVKKKIKIVIFGDLNNIICRVLFWQMMKLSKEKNIELIKFYNTAKNNENLIKNIINFIFIKIFNPLKHNFFFNNTGIFIKFFSNIDIQNIPNINEKNFVKYLHQSRYDYAFSFCCNQIFKKKTLKCFKKVINYHSSILPNYRGLNSTLWSIFFEEKFTGYTFHYTSSKIDNGKIILKNKFKIDYQNSYKKIEMYKTILAKNSLRKVLNLVLKKFKGNSQSKKGSYYGKKDIKRITTYREIKNIQLIKKVINIWGGIILIKNNKKFYITKINDYGNISGISYYPAFIFNFLTFKKNL
tara:strand:+ start:643 stop:1536 length:894 start_codon:yes stop_codon:yes gene_type:complete